jgi:hypothetical protein
VRLAPALPKPSLEETTYDLEAGLAVLDEAAGAVNEVPGRGRIAT